MDDAGKISKTIRKMVLLRGSGNSISPEEIARAVAGKDARKWRHLLKPVRAQVIVLAQQGEIVVKRKGVLVNLDKLRGPYRISLAQGTERHETAQTAPDTPKTTAD